MHSIYHSLTYLSKAFTFFWKKVSYNFSCYYYLFSPPIFSPHSHPLLRCSLPLPSPPTPPRFLPLWTRTDCSATHWTPFPTLRDEGFVTPGTPEISIFSPLPLRSDPPFARYSSAFCCCKSQKSSDLSTSPDLVPSTNQISLAQKPAW